MTAMPIDHRLEKLRRIYDPVRGATVNHDPFLVLNPTIEPVDIEVAVEQYGRFLTAADDARRDRDARQQELAHAEAAHAAAEARLEAATDVLHKSANAHQKAAAGTPVSTVDTGSDQ